MWVVWMMDVISYILITQNYASIKIHFLGKKREFCIKSYNF